VYWGKQGGKGKVNSRGTDFRNITEEDLAFGVKKINHRPKKCLGYQSPHEVFWKTQNGALAT
jgi:IS30 family transposase